MDGKVPKTTLPRNKNAPKAIKNGVWRTGNQLVRMRSPVQIWVAAPESPVFPAGKAGFFLYFSTFPTDLKFEIQT